MTCIASSTNNNSYYNNGGKPPHVLDYLKDAMTPAEVAISCDTYFLQLLVNLRAQISVPINRSHYDGQYNDAYRKSILDWVSWRIETLRDEIVKLDQQQKQQRQILGITLPSRPSSFQEYRQDWKARLAVLVSDEDTLRENNSESTSAERTLAYYEEMEGILKNSGAKTYYELYTDVERKTEQKVSEDSENKGRIVTRYFFVLR